MTVPTNAQDDIMYSTTVLNTQHYNYINRYASRSSQTSWEDFRMLPVQLGIVNNVPSAFGRYKFIPLSSQASDERYVHVNMRGIIV